MGTRALIGLGSNLGDRKAHLDAAIAALAGTPEIEVCAVSSYHETAPVGGPEGQGGYLNASAVLETSLDAFTLLRELQRIEQAEGRVRTARWGARTLDLDLLLFGCKFLDTPELILPHPWLALRRFVLAPLAEIAPDFVETVTGDSIAALLNNLDRRPSYLALDGESPVREPVFQGIVAGLTAIEICGRSADIKSLASLIQSDRWPADRVGDRWLVSDFSFDMDVRLGLDVRASWTFQEPTEGTVTSGWIQRQDEHYRWIGRPLKPTFIVLLDGTSRLARKARACKSPLLWPKSSEPDAIVAEILAACAATRSA